MSWLEYCYKSLTATARYTLSPKTVCELHEKWEYLKVLWWQAAIKLLALFHPIGWIQSKMKKILNKRNFPRWGNFRLLLSCWHMLERSFQHRFSVSGSAFWLPVHRLWPQIILVTQDGSGFNGGELRRVLHLYWCQWEHYWDSFTWDHSHLNKYHQWSLSVSFLPIWTPTPSCDKDG